MADIVLKDRLGVFQTYEGVNKVLLNTAEGGTQLFTAGEAIENMPIALDFSGEENQTVTAPEGYLVKSAIIQKPAGLIPENIAEGITIAGIEGNHKGGGGIDERLGFFKLVIDMTNKVITLYGVMYDLIYAATGSYDVTIPDHFIGFEDYSVVIAAV